MNLSEMECSIESFSESMSERKKNCINYYEICSVLALNDSIENNIENKEKIDYIEKLIQSYIEFLDDKTVFTYISKNTEWFSPKEIIEIKRNFKNFIRQIYQITIKNNISIISTNSVIDILGNWPHNYMQYILNQINKNREYSDYINNVVETIKSLQILINIYLKKLCSDEKKLHIALTNHNGYIERYSWYFKKMNSKNGNNYIMYPSGSKKLYYFHFFQSCEIGDIWYINLEEQLKKLDDDILNKEKIRTDFPNFEIL